MNTHRVLTCVVLTLALFGWAGCKSVGVPKEKSNYVGEWKGVGMSLTITADGGVAYERTGGSGNKKINAPIQAWSGNNFEVGVGPIATTFEVNKPPFQDGDVWKMIVDKVELTRIR